MRIHLAETRKAIRGLALMALFFSTVAFADDPPQKILRLAFPTAVTNFDPAYVSDLYSSTVNEAVFERLLTYDYLARPVKLIPMLAESLPDISQDGKVYTFRIKKNVFFQDDPAFSGNPRELTADDFVYSFKRVLDPKVRSSWTFLLDGKIQGLDAVVEQARQSGTFDYKTPVDGLRAIDRYTFQVRLNAPDYNFGYIVAHTPLSVMAQEVVEYYGDDIGSHPVGTGAYLLTQWVRGSKLALEKSPSYRKIKWDFDLSEIDDDPLIQAMKGKELPLIDRVEISIIEEEQSSWLAFKRYELDFSGIGSFRDEVLTPKRTLKPLWEKEGVRLVRNIIPEITYTFFNFKDPIVGGFSNDKLALRRAIIMAYNRDEEIRVIRKGQAIPATMPIPVGVIGHDDRYRPLNRYDPITANKLLDAFDYKKDAHGWRTMPDGTPLVLKMSTGTTAIERQFNELWKKSMDAIAVKIEFIPGKFADHVKAARACQLQMWSAAWTADYPDGDNFMQLLYGPNTGESNNGCYQSAAFDEFYQKAQRMPDSPERNRLFLEMTRQMEVDGAWGLGVSRERNTLVRPWLIGYKSHPILSATWQYMDIDLAIKSQYTRR
ncbi:MAG: ABC transporter substrate-binding protein [Burkholderiales bacterium]|jgi:ABC-type transport system substrate-binding protein|nr:ABC transporter substrate-binding protein [Burkholderiales bacterium]